MKKISVLVAAFSLYTISALATPWSAGLDCISANPKKKLNKIVNLSVSVGGNHEGYKATTLIDQYGLASILKDKADSSGSREIWTGIDKGQKFKYSIVNKKVLKKSNRDFSDYSYNYEKFEATLIIETIPSKKDSNTPKVKKIITDKVICSAEYNGID